MKLAIFSLAVVGWLLGPSTFADDLVCGGFRGPVDVKVPKPTLEKIQRVRMENVRFLALNDSKNYEAAHKKYSKEFEQYMSSWKTKDESIRFFNASIIGLKQERPRGYEVIIFDRTAKDAAGQLVGKFCKTFFSEKDFSGNKIVEELKKDRVMESSENGFCPQGNPNYKPFTPWDEKGNHYSMQWGANTVDASENILTIRLQNPPNAPGFRPRVAAAGAISIRFNRLNEVPGHNTVVVKHQGVANGFVGWDTKGQLSFGEGSGFKVTDEKTGQVMGFTSKARAVDLSDRTDAKALVLTPVTKAPNDKPAPVIGCLDPASAPPPLNSPTSPNEGGVPGL